MALDSGVISGYLIAFLLRGARRLADRSFESLLDKLANVIEQRIGRRPLETLQRNPGDTEANSRLCRKIEAAARTDQAFASELETLIRKLDRRGGRKVINQVYAQKNVQAFDQGIAVGRDLHFNVPDPTDLSGAPGWVKTMYALGAVVAVLGLGYVMFTLKSDGSPISFGVFILGCIMLLIGEVGRAMSKRK